MPLENILILLFCFAVRQPIRLTSHETNLNTDFRVASNRVQLFP